MMTCLNVLVVHMTKAFRNGSNNSSYPQRRQKELPNEMLTDMLLAECL